MENCCCSEKSSWSNQMVGRFCIVRTYSAGVHVGWVKSINPQDSQECVLERAYRLWKWENGGLSLSAILTNGLKGGRVNYTPEVMITCAIEYLPADEEQRVQLERSLQKYTEDYPVDQLPAIK